MARFRCRACGEEGAFFYDGRNACPNCNSPDVQFALGIEELPDDVIVELTKVAEESDDED